MPAKKPSPERIEETKNRFQVIESKTLESQKERFFKLPYNAALEAIDADLSKTAYRLWIYLSANYPFGDRDIDLPSQTELGIRLNVTRQSINIAAAELQAAGLWDFWSQRWQGRNLKGFTSSSKAVRENQQVSEKIDTLSKKSDIVSEKIDTVSEKSDTGCQKNLTPNEPQAALHKGLEEDRTYNAAIENQEVSEKIDTVSKKSDTGCQKNLTPCQKNLTPCQKNLTPNDPQAALDNDLKEDKTLKTYSYFLKTLSEGERESFLEFGKKKAAELKNPPVQLPLKWIEAHFEELKDLWEKHRSSTGSTHCGTLASTNVQTHCGAPASTNVQNYESWEASSHEGQYHTLMNLGLAKFCLNAISKGWYEWAKAKHPERFVNVPD